MGPETDPMLHIALMMPKYFPRYRSGTRSVMTISLKAMIPPPPTPCTDRPTSMYVKLSAMAHTIAPTQKNRIAIRTIGRRPKTLEKEAKLGWNTVLVSIE
jgi:hypothetical protein